MGKENRVSKKRFVFVTLLGFYLLAASAPATAADGINITEQWNNTFGGTGDDYGYSVQQTADGGYIIAGYTLSYGAGDADIWLIKTDREGNEQWNRTFGGTKADLLDRGSVQQTSDGGYVITGYTYSYGAGDADAWVIKTDENGIEQWNRTFGGEGLDWGHSVQQTSDEGYIIAGRTEPYAGARADAWLIKTNSHGLEEWNRTFGTDACEYAASVQQTSDGGYIIAGRTTSYGAGVADAWLIRTDCNGIEKWNRTFGGAGYDYGYSVQQTSDGGYIVVGSTNNRQDIWLIKTDTEGMEEWNSIFGGTAMDEGYSVQQTADGGYLIAGYTASYGAGSGDVWLIKTDTSGNEQWNETFGNAELEKGCSVQQTADGGYIAAGYTQSYGAGGYDVWLIKLSVPIDLKADEIEAYYDTNATNTRYLNLNNEVKVKITNDGSVSAGPFEVTLLANDKIADTQTLPGLDANSSIFAVFNWTPIYNVTKPSMNASHVSKNFSLKAMVDPEKKIIELNESNNILTVNTSAIWNGRMGGNGVLGVSYITTRHHGKLHGGIIYTFGDSHKFWKHKVKPGNPYIVNYNVTLPQGAEVELAKIYTYFEWFVTEQPKADATFTTPVGENFDLPIDDWYWDKGYAFIFGQYLWGVLKYDVTPYINESGTYTFNLTHAGGSEYYMDGALLFIVYREQSKPLIEYYVSEGADLLGGRDIEYLRYEDTTAKAELKGGEMDITNVTKATLFSVVNWGFDTNLWFNGHLIGENCFTPINSLREEIVQYNLTSIPIPYLNSTYNLVEMEFRGYCRNMPANAFLVLEYEEKEIFDFDTGTGDYPSIMGVHSGTITPAHDIFVEQMYTYPCEGTGGHSEYIKIRNATGWNVSATWTGYAGDWHNISFDAPFTLEKNETYNYTIKTGSYPQIIHKQKLETKGGEITCSQFEDANGKIYRDWIPAIKLLGAKTDTWEDLGNLTDDFYNLPEIVDGISEKELSALKQISVLTKSKDTEVQRGLQLIDKYGVPGYVFDHPEGGIPDYNTQLEVLLWLAENRSIVDEYDRIALCLALDYGSVVTIGDDQVDQSVRQYVLDRYDYVKETDEVLREKNISWRAKDYPLDAGVGLCWGANKLRYPTFYDYVGQDPGQPWMHYWRDEFRDRQMNIEDFNWLFVSKETLEEMREWAFDNGLVNRSNMGETAELIDVYVSRHHKYYTDKPGTPPTYFEVEGKITSGCRISNPDWQWEYFKQNGTIVGNCEDLCFADCMFLLSLNIGKYAGTVRSESFGHHVILFCDTENNVLKTTSRQIDVIEGHATPPIMYMGYKVPWDNFCGYGIYSFWITSDDKKLLESGIPFSYLGIE